MTVKDTKIEIGDNNVILSKIINETLREKLVYSDYSYLSRLTSLAAR